MSKLRHIMGATLATMALIVAMPRGAAAQELEFRAPPSATDAATPAAMRDLAERLLPVYQEPDPDRYLANLSALQMAAGDYGPADVSRNSLRDRRRRADAGRPVGRGAIFDIYAHAKALEAENKMSFGDAYLKAYQDAISRLSDHDAMAVARWLEIPLESSEEALERLLDEQRPKDIINQTEAVNLIWAYLYFEAYRAFGPLAAPLASEDDARRYFTDNDVLIHVPDLPNVAATVIRPKGVSGRLPTLLEMGIAADESSAKESAAHGYVGMAARLSRRRARLNDFAPFQHDGDEVRAAINWIVKQPWSDGRVALHGQGYSGFTAWAAAARLPAALKAIATADPTAPGIDAPMSGNIFQNSAYRWSLEVTNSKPAQQASFADEALWRSLNEKWYRSGRRYRDFGRIFGRPNPIFIRWLNHPSYDRFWQKMIPYADQFARINIPVLTVTGYFADSEPAAVYYFAEHYRHDPHADHTLLVGPYDDGALGRGPAAVLRGYEVDAAALIDLREIEYQWFDHVLKGAPAPPQLSDRVNYEVMGSNEWRHVATLDAMAGAPLRYFLDAAGSVDSHRLTKRKSAKIAAVAQTISLKDRSDAGWLPPADLISKSLVTHNAAMFVSDPLSKPAELSGLFSGNLDFTVNKMDMDINVALYELAADGDYLRLFNPAYELRLSYAQDRVHRHLLKAGERQQVSFKSERITSRRLEKGSRLVVVLRVSKRPDREINYGTGEDVSEESLVDGKVPLKVLWYNDSYIEIPARTAAPARQVAP